MAANATVDASATKAANPTTAPSMLHPNCWNRIGLSKFHAENCVSFLSQPTSQTFHTPPHKSLLFDWSEIWVFLYETAQALHFASTTVVEVDIHKDSQMAKNSFDIF